MTNALPPRVRAMIINFDPTQPEALTISEFCKTQKISRSIFYRLRRRAANESAAVLHPLSRAPKQPARKYGPEVTNELVKIRQRLKKDGWDYGPRTVHYEATINENQFPGEEIPSVATIARLLSGVGHVDRNPRKRPKSSYVPFARSTAMALWQLDAFEYRTAKNQLITIYQLIDDASRFDLGSRAFQRHKNSQDAQDVLMQAITEYGAPQEVLSDNSKAFNQLRSGTIGSVEIFLASKGSMPSSGLPGKPTTQGKNERSHRTLQRFLKANRPQDLAEAQKILRRYREHYNQRRPHQSLNQATPQAAWDLLEHTPAIEPIALTVLEAKAAEYLSKRRLAQSPMSAFDVVVSKSGDIMQSTHDESDPVPLLSSNQMLVEVTKENRRTFYQGFHISLPTSFAHRQFIRTITDTEFLLSDPETSEIVMSFPLPMVALKVQGKFVSSYSIRGIQMTLTTRQREKKVERYRAVIQAQEEQIPTVFEHQ
ncbi:integrase core domain-containing protein [Glutamicibacter ardleyensis]|uniref:integrase core domain-containing protein n=1 Tax=Glutamicibacter ardleyensis TaxID=225894 RepID=UPI003FD67C76